MVSFGNSWYFKLLDVIFIFLSLVCLKVSTSLADDLLPMFLTGLKD